MHFILIHSKKPWFKYLIIQTQNSRKETCDLSHWKSETENSASFHWSLHFHFKSKQHVLIVFSYRTSSKQLILMSSLARRWAASWTSPVDQRNVYDTQGERLRRWMFWLGCKCDTQTQCCWSLTLGTIPGLWKPKHVLKITSIDLFN